MLLSAVIDLSAISTSPILGALGRPAQAWFLGQVMQKHAGLAASLHDETGAKPYTVSTLLDRRGFPLRAGAVLEPGEHCWLRITTFNQELSEIFLDKILSRLPDRLGIYKMDFRVDGYTLNPAEHPWAGQASFEELAQAASYQEAGREVRMEFASPTAFRSNGNDIALPMPAQVFRSLFQKWNAFCPEAMQVQEMWPTFVEDCILVSELTAVNTVHWIFAEGTRGAATGFTGTVGFTLLPKSKIPEKWAPFWDGAVAVMQSLARFAFYAGVGHHSTIGMGQARPLAMQKESVHGNRVHGRSNS